MFSEEKLDCMSHVLDLLIFLIPLYIANSAPVVLGGGPPLDFGMTLQDKRRLLGKSKTLRGFVAGILAGTVVGGLIASYYVLPFFSSAQEQFIAFFLVGLGAMSGDTIGSFIKRRVGVEPGGPFFLDTFLFVVVSLLFVLPIAKAQLYEPFNVLFFVGLSIVVHRGSNAAANRLGLKKVPW